MLIHRSTASPKSSSKAQADSKPSSESTSQVSLQTLIPLWPRFLASSTNALSSLHIHSTQILLSLLSVIFTAAKAGSTRSPRLGLPFFLFAPGTAIDSPTSADLTVSVPPPAAAAHHCSLLLTLKFSDVIGWSSATIRCHLMSSRLPVVS